MVRLFQPSKRIESGRKKFTTRICIILNLKIAPFFGQIKVKLSLLTQVTSTPKRYFFIWHIDCLVNYSACARKQKILNGTKGDIISDSYFYRYNQTCSWKIMANKREQVKLVLSRMYVHPWCGLSCSCGHLEIQNATYADGSAVTRMCSGTFPLGNATIYSHVGHDLRIQAVTLPSWWVSIRASYTVIRHKDTVSDGKKSEGL